MAVYLQFTGDTPGFSSVSPTKNKSHSKVVKFTEKMRHELKRVENQFSDFCDIYFLSFGQFCAQN